MPEYEVTTEREEDLKNFRIKLLELFILTISAIFITSSFLKNRFLVIPPILLIIDTIFIIMVLMLGANKGTKEFDGDNLEVRVKQTSYELTFTEYVALIIYSISILVFGYIMIFN